jgi:hypothetical protein
MFFQWTYLCFGIFGLIYTKNLSIILLTLISLAGSCQSSSTAKMNIVGVWTLTDYNAPNKFEDTWEFRADSIFNELKHKTDGDSTLVPDENGAGQLREIGLE